ncbi:uncharacterized protein V6R79_021407 [Siganus canaliculatus]
MHHASSEHFNQSRFLHVSRPFHKHPEPLKTPERITSTVWKTPLQPPDGTQRNHLNQFNKPV